MIKLLSLISLAVLPLSACAPSGDSTFGHNGYVSAAGTVRLIGPGMRGAPIDLRGRDVQGTAIVVPTRAPGRATVINVWWSGCAECRAEAPILSAASHDPTLSADFAGINIREVGIPQAKRFEEHFGIDYPSFYDPAGRLLLYLHHAVPYAAIPSTIVLDPSGRVGAVILGAVPSLETLRDVVHDVLGTK